MPTLLGFTLTTVGLILSAVLGIILLFTLAARVMRWYHRIPPNKALVIFGRGKTVVDQRGQKARRGVRIVTGGATLVFPLFEEYAELDLRMITIPVAGDMVYTIDGIPVKLDWVAQVQLNPTEDSLRTAATAFLGRNAEEIRLVIEQTLSTNFRAIVGQMTVESIHRDRDAFVQKVQGLAADEMAAMGVRVISIGVKEITDDQGYFRAMATKQIVTVKRDAQIAEAEANREARVKAAEAKRASEEAELNAQRAVLEQQQALELRTVEKERAVKQAQAESEREVQRRRAEAVAQEQEASVLVPARAKRQAVEIEAEAERTALVIKAEAQAEAARKTAAAQAEATRMGASADAEATEKKGRAAAESKKAELSAEAEGIRAKLLGEAEGKQKLADATAAQGEINLRQAVSEAMILADVRKMEALANALQGIGENVRVVQFGGGNTASGSNALMQMLQDVPELVALINAKTESLSGKSLPEIMGEVSKFLKGQEVEPSPAKPRRRSKKLGTSAAQPKN